MTLEVDEYKVSKQLIEESQNMPNGWFEEVYYDGSELTFSSPMTGNTWTNDPEKVGRLDAWSIDEMEGLKLADNNTVEISKDSNYYFEGIEQEDYIKEKPKDYDQFYDESVYAEYSEVLEWIVDIATENSWFDEIIREIEERDEKAEQEVSKI